MSNKYNNLILHLHLSWGPTGEELDLNAQNFPNQNTALHFAVLQNDCKTVVQLLFVGAKAEIKNADAMTPLHLAIRQGNIEIVKTLLKDASPHTETAGFLPLHWAVVYNQPEIAALLIKAGAQGTLTPVPNYLPSSGLVFSTTQTMIASRNAQAFLNSKNTAIALPQS